MTPDAVSGYLLTSLYCTSTPLNHLSQGGLVKVFPRRMQDYGIQTIYGTNAIYPFW